MRQIDCLLVHTPKHYHNGILFSRCSNITLMPMGLAAMCAELARAGIVSGIVHTGLLETYEQPLTLPAYCLQKGVKVVCFALHWHHQAYDVLYRAQQIRESIPGITVVLGGITASYFAEQILANFSCIDYIIKGYAYYRLPGLVKKILNQENTRAIPSLIGSGEKALPDCPDCQPMTDACFNALSFTDLSYMEDYERYLKMPWIWLGDKSSQENEANDLRLPIPIGLGCEHHCSYCGGNEQVQKDIFSINGLFYLAPHRVLEQMQKALEFGVKGFHICFNPSGKGDDDYYEQLFGLIRKQDLNPAVNFECWGLPSAQFIELFARTFDSDSVITISPETGSESVRKKNKTLCYSNNDLSDCLRTLQQNRVKTTLFFTSGLPFETRSDIIFTGVMQQKWLAAFRNITVMSMPIELEPGSPMFLEPDKYQIIKKRNTFMDYYQAHKSETPSLGYDSRAASESEIIECSSRNLVNFVFV